MNMNDFTKEELMSVQYCIEVASGEDSSIRDSRKEIHNKIQSMIHDYCAHDFVPFTSFRDICTKCNGIF